MFDPDLDFPYIVSPVKPLCKAATTCLTKQHYKATMVAVGRQLTLFCGSLKNRVLVPVVVVHCRYLQKEVPQAFIPAV